MIQRQASKELHTLAEQFKAVAVVGPRQSGKTTLIKKLFAEKPYVNLENPDERNFANEDPRGFLEQYSEGAVFDEVQRTPELFSYLQQVLDESKKPGKFILSGSNNFLLRENISQSLAGRVGFLFLFPLIMKEYPSIPETENEAVFTGSYPAVHAGLTDVKRFYLNYTRTYIERDVRLLKNISNLDAFERFIKLCAGRTGQLINLSSLAVETGVDVNTVKSWLSVLEASFIIFRLRPYRQNFNKRLVKMPKLYFTDTGLVCHLLGIENPQQVQTHPLKGSLFENFVIAEILKTQYNRGKTGKLYFWRNNVGNEVDLILEKGGKPIPVEIKAGKTITSDYFKGLKYWQKISGLNEGYVIYAGKQKQKRSSGFTVLPYTDIPVEKAV